MTLAFITAPIFIRRAEQLLKNHKILDNKKRWIVLDGRVLFPILDKPSFNINFYYEIKHFPEHVFPKRGRNLSLQQLERLYNIKLPKSISILGDIILINKIPDDIDDLDKMCDLLLSNFGSRAVFYKEHEISSQYRIGRWRKLCGIGSTLTIHKEWLYYYIVDVSKAFFNPRMSEERLRVIRSSAKNEVVIDMFSGVGPFAIPISKKGTKTFAIDINPSAIGFLSMNTIINKAHLKFFLGDCRDKITSLPAADRIIMNFPERAIEFLPYALNKIKINGVIHLYHFQRAEKAKDAIQQTIEMIKNEISSFKVIYKSASKDVAPHKYLVVIDILIKRI